MFLGAKYSSDGATVAALIVFWLADAIPDQPEKSPKLIEPHFDPKSCVVAYTRFCPLYGAVVKSFSDTQPDFGVASAPDDDQRYEDGSEHEPPPPGEVVVVRPDVGGRVVDVGVGVPGLEHPSADAATSPATTRTGPFRTMCERPLTLIGR
jgi:hypothetical protein